MLLFCQYFTYFTLSLWCYSDVEDALYRSLKYSVILKAESTTKKNATEPYEYINRGKHDYLCTINAIKEYNDYINENKDIPRIHGISYSNLNSYMNSLESQCIVHYDRDKHDLVYSICFFSHVSIVSYTDDETFANKRLLVYRGGTDYTDELLNADIRRRQQSNLNNFYTQVYNSSACIHNKDISDELKINFYCDPEVEQLAVCRTQQINNCYTEITIHDKRLCSIPLFQPDFSFSSKSSQIECKIISDTPVKIEETPVQTWFRTSLDSSRSVMTISEDNLKLPIFSISTREMQLNQDEILKNTIFIARTDENGDLKLVSETTNYMPDVLLEKKMESDRFVQFISEPEYFKRVYNNEMIINMEANDMNVRFLSDTLMNLEGENKPDADTDENDFIEPDDIF